MSDSRPETYCFGPPESRSFLAGLRLPQVAALAGGGIVSLGVLRVRPDGAGLGIALALMLAAAAVAFVSVSGRHLDEWAPTVVRWVGGAHGRRFLSETPQVGEIAGAGGTTTPPAPLAGLRILSVATAEGTEVAVAKDERAGTYTAVVAVRGAAFALLDRTEQQRRLATWSDVLSGWAREGSPVHRLQWVERTVPEDGDVMDRYLSEAQVLDADAPAVGSYMDLLEAAQPITQRHEVYLALSVSAGRSGRAMRASGGGDVGACELLLREVRHLESRLGAADVTVEGVLGSRELARTLRTAFDPDAGLALARRARGDDDLLGAAPRNAYPLAAETTWSSYRTDGAWHATFWVAEWPRLEVGPDFLTPLLLQTPGRRTVSLVMEPIAASRAARAVEAAHTSYLADEELRNKAGYLTTARRRREHDAILRREQELADGHAECRFSGYVTVTTTDRDELEPAAAAVVQCAHQARLDLRRLYGDQDEAFTYTLPLARGLR